MDTKRFNHPEYKRQIRAVRNYHREVPLRPEKVPARILYFLGLGSAKRKALALVFLALVIYLIYFAKFFQLTEIKINGADSAAAATIRDNFTEYTKSYLGRILPQKNILLFNGQRFINYLLSNNYQVAAVERLHRHLPHTLEITVFQRTPQYLLENGANFFILNSDSTIGSQVAGDQGNGLLPFKDSAEEQLNSGEKLLDQGRNEFLRAIIKALQQQLSLKATAFELPGRAADQIFVYTDKGYKILLSFASDSAKDIEHLSQIWLQLSPEQQAQVAYIDLRFDKNAYLCYKNQPCAK